MRAAGDGQETWRTGWWVVGIFARRFAWWQTWVSVGLGAVVSLSVNGRLKRRKFEMWQSIDYFGFDRKRPTAKSDGKSPKRATMMFL